MMEARKQTQFSTRLQLSQRGGQTQILAMTAGEGNGWKITAEALKESLPLWEKAQSFVDHAWQGHTVRDLCGVLSNVEWDEEHAGIRAVFNPFGPAAQVAAQVAADALAQPELALGVGFSADVVFTHTGKTVDRFIGVLSVDLVIDPARGGKWLRALNRITHQGEPDMPDINTTPSEEATQALERLQAQKASIETDGKRQAELNSIQEANQAAGRLRAQMCASVLQAALAASNLPAPMQERIRQDYSNRLFEPAELDARIEADRSLLTA
jgi:hypothetical protein